MVIFHSYVSLPEGNNLYDAIRARCKESGQGDQKSMEIWIWSDMGIPNMDWLLANNINHSWIPWFLDVSGCTSSDFWLVTSPCLPLMIRYIGLLNPNLLVVKCHVFLLWRLLFLMVKPCNRGENRHENRVFSGTLCAGPGQDLLVASAWYWHGARSLLGIPPLRGYIDDWQVEWNGAPEFQTLTR